MHTRLIHEVRAIKNQKELSNIIKAQRISEQVLADTLAILKVGISEIEVESFVKQSFIKYKAPILSFSPIVAFGKNSANIHHTPSEMKLQFGDIIMFDFGTTINNYCSDMTRTFFYGTSKDRKGIVKQKRLIKVYKDVLKANKLAIAKIMRGEKNAKKIDSSARDFLTKKYKNNFKHGLGHGVGTVIHEWPNFKPNTSDILPVDCVMTVEPGIYIRGLGGVRIEDMIRITKKGGENLTNFSKDLKSIILKV